MQFPIGTLSSPGEQKSDSVSIGYSTLEANTAIMETGQFVLPAKLLYHNTKMKGQYVMSMFSSVPFRSVMQKGM